MGRARALQADVGVCGREVHDGSDLVVLLILDSGLFATSAWIAPDANWIADSGDLCDFRRGQRDGRVAVVQVDQKRIVGKCRAEMGDVHLRGERSAHCHCVSGVGTMARDTPDWASGRGTPRIIRKSLYADVGSVTFTYSGSHGGNREDGVWWWRQV